MTTEWTLIDIGYEDAVDECVELIRQLDFPFSKCKTLIASHADVDHIQGLAKAKQMLKTTVTAHPLGGRAAGERATGSPPSPRSPPRTSTSTCRR